MSEIEEYTATFHEPWMAQGLCIGASEVFYPERSNSKVQHAKNICKGEAGTTGCPVRDQCLDYALENNEKYGVWGGTSERERRKLQRQRRARGVIPVTAPTHTHHKSAPPEVPIDIIRKGRRLNAPEEQEAEVHQQQAG